MIKGLTERERKKKAIEFSKQWEGKGNEKSDSQKFWLQLLRDVYEVENPEKYILFEDRVRFDKTAYLDAIIDETHVLIEQKSIEKDLSRKIKQSDGSELTPFEQARKYDLGLSYSRRAKWIITCNFREFYIYDMDDPTGEPYIIELKNFGKEYNELDFIIKKEYLTLKKEQELSLKAGDIVAEIYDAFEKEYIENDIEDYSKHLNKLCVRIVFCLYAEDSGLFGKKNMFHDLLYSRDEKNIRTTLVKLFKILNTPENDRDPFEDQDLLQFPYVNGGLFKDDDLVIPYITDNIRKLLLAKASDDFDWSEISPTIFGAVFESTLNPETRREGGMHYTSIENIHKVIDPLFLNDLKDELNKIKRLKQVGTVEKRISNFQDKLASLKFLDPACGSGNFLTETYLSIRKLENEALKYYYDDETVVINPIKVSIAQFYGIEINDFAVEVAKTALWIAESQMKKQTQEILTANIDFLPLETNAYIVNDNALTCDWNSVVDKKELSYIISNPPFIGARLMNQTQKSELNSIFSGWKNTGNLDYVCAWYKKANDYIFNTDISVCFVSTNSITQGEQVPILWKKLINEYGVEINFAYRTFMWDSEANTKAHVYCVIIAFSRKNIENKDRLKVIYDNGKYQIVKNINPYLMDADNIFIEERSQPICDVNKMVFGSMPNDGGYLSKYTLEERNRIIKEHPQSIDLFKKIVGSEEYINNVDRYCLWLKDVSPSVIKSIKPIYDAVNNVRIYRSQSKREATRKLANIPHLFAEIRQPNGNYLLVPSVSSDRRPYLPMGFMDSSVISNNLNLLVPDASLYHFGVLTSRVHMVWMRAVAGRLGMNCRYSAKIVYNNFPWPIVSNDTVNAIKESAEKIISIREKYSDSSFAVLYDANLMPIDLREAHEENDKNVMKAYAMNPNFDDATILSILFKLYENKVRKENE